MPENIIQSLEDAGYSFALAVATEAEINAQAACGQLGLIEQE